MQMEFLMVNSLYETHLQGIVRGSFIHQNKHPVQDDEYYYDGSLQASLKGGIVIFLAKH